jgi:cell division protein FtsB
MSSRSLPLVRTRQQARTRVEQGTLSVPAIIGITVALLVLFLWMRFIVAMQIEATGRQIQAKTEELEKLERSNAALQRTIAESLSQENLSARAQALDYQIQTPVYLVISEPLAQPDPQAIGADIWVPMAEGSGEPSSSQSEPAPSALAHSSSNPEETSSTLQQ